MSEWVKFSKMRDWNQIIYGYDLICTSKKDNGAKKQ